MKLSFVMPVLNEADGLVAQLDALQGLRQQGHELVLVDGGSVDGSIELAEPLVDRLLRSPRGRARQMNAGAGLASGDVLVFLHSDTRLPPDAASLIARALQVSSAGWGWFDVRLANPAWPYALIGWCMSRRARLTRVCTGDQTLFVRRELFEALGGFPMLPLMEDVAMSKRLRRQSRACVIRQAATTSSRRWEQGGIVATVLLMWRLRLLYFLGVAPERLVRRYYPGHEQGAE